jgi:hypothetical protein
MPFTKLVDDHRCDTPKTRDDGSKLVIGDEWACDATMRNSSGSKCNKKYRWTDSQMDGAYWKPLQ